MSSVTGPGMDPQGRAQKAPLRSFEEVSRSNAAKRRFLIKEGGEYQEIQIGSFDPNMAKTFNLKQTLFDMKSGNKVPLTVGRVIFLLHFLPDSEFEFQKEALRLAMEALETFKVAEDSLTVSDPSDYGPFNVEDLLLMPNLLKAIHSLEPRKIDGAMKPLVKKLETVQRELEKKYEAEMPRLMRREIRWFEQVQAGYQHTLDSLKKYRDKVQDLQQLEKRALEVRDQIAQFDFNLLPPLPISVGEFEAFLYQEDTRLPCLRNLRANSSDQKAFTAALLENRDKIKKELIHEMLVVELQILAEKLSGIVPGESSNREYLTNLNREAFDQLGGKLKQDEKSAGSLGTSKQEAVRRLANYTQNYSEICAILQEKRDLETHIIYVVPGVIEKLQERQLRLEALDSKASPEEVNRRQLLCALNKICLKVCMLDEIRELLVKMSNTQWDLEVATWHFKEIKRIHAEYRKHFPDKTKTKTE